MANETIVTNIVANANFSSLIANVQRATAELAQLKGALSTTNKALAMDAAKIQQGFASTLRSTGQFSTHFVSLASDVDKFGKNLDQGKLKLKDYYRAFQDHTRSSGGLIRELARQQVQLQNAILQPLGRNAEGLMQFNVQIPRGLDLTKNKTALLKQEMQIFNKVIQDGGVQLINWGKNTQWAGRQLTVGLTVPIAAFGLAASKAFREADEQLVRLTKVYGGVAQTSAVELSKVRKEVSATARELASAYGASYKETIALAADIAATGKQGNDLIKSTQETTRLSILGEVDRQEAMKATLAIQTAFKQNTTQLSESINFLNAVENQTSTSLADLVEAIPKAGPVIQSLGGSIQDLALYLTAMKEGGVNASEGANAIKSSLASLINPTKVAKEMFQGFGINLENIVTSNAGNLTGMMVELQGALDKLDPLSKSRAIEQLFGKFQFARMSALFENLGKQGSQTLQVLDLMKTSTQDLASIADRELSQITESASGKYKRALESLKASLAGVGEQFLNIGTFFINVIDKVVQFANKLPDPIKKLLTFAAGFTALTGPIIMLTGVLANFLGYIVKGAAHFRALFKGAEGWRLLTPEILAAQKAGNLLETTFYSDAKAASILATALHNLNEEFARLKLNANSGVSAAPTISTVSGQVLMTGTAQREVDTSSEYLSAKDTRAYSHPNPVSRMSQAEKDAQTIFGIVPGATKVNQKIGSNAQMYMDSDLPKISGVSAIKGVSTGIVAGEAARWHAMTGALAMQSKAEIELLKREVAATGLITTSLSDSYQALLPEMHRITSLAALESAEIVAQLQSSKITVDQARARVIALNQQIEAMMGQAATQVATAQGRTVNLTQLPIVNQPAFDPVSGKANMKELTRPGRTRDLFNTIARVLGVKTYGAPYSIETTRPKRFDKGGDVEGFGPNKTIVSGPSSIKYDDRLGNVPLNGYVLNQGASLDPKNKRLVDMAPTTYGSGGPSMKALLTPKETVFGPGIHKNPELYAAVDAANNGYSFGGNIMRQKKNYGAATAQAGTVEENDLFAIAKRLNVSDYDEDFRIRTVLHDAAILSQYMSPDEAIDMADEYLREARRRAYDPSMQDINPDLWKEIRQEQILRADELIKARTGKSILAPKNSTFTRTGVGRKFSTSAVVPTAQLIMAMRARGGDFSQVALNDIVGEISKVIDIDPKTGKSRSGRVAFVTEHPNPMNEFDIHGDGNLFTGIAGSESHNSATNRQRVRSRGVVEDRLPLSGKAASQRDLMLGKYYGMPGLLSAIARRRNMGGDIPGGDVSFNRNSYGTPPLPASALARLTARWKPKKQFYPQGMQYILGNQDPLHGPLQIGKSMVPKNRQNDLDWTREVLYDDPQFARQNVMQQFPTGSLEERGRYILRQYMSGNYQLMEAPGSAAALKTLVKKYRGKLYRGVRLGKSTGSRLDSLPKEIADAIELAQSTGDFSSLIGKEFIMRRSSWSKDAGIASYFAPGYSSETGDGKSILIEALVKNRNVIPAGDIFPDVRFPAPFGQARANLPEEEAIFGGKFRVIGFENGKLQVETVVDGARAKGGPVNANRPYLVGENGPEIFVPKNSGGIIPGGDIVKNRTGYGLPNIPTMPGYEIPLATQMGMTPTQSLQDTPGRQPMNPYGMKAQVLGMGAMMGGPMLGQAMGGNTGMMIGMGLGQVASMLPFMIKGALDLSKIIKFTSFGIAIASAIAFGKLLLKLKKDAEDTGKANRLTFGGNETTLGEAGLAGKYKTLSTRLKDINMQLDLQRAKSRASYDSSTQSGVKGLTLTIKELRDQISSVKKDMPETLAAFNNIDSSKVNELALSLKTQYVSMGMSVEQATNKIYALIAASNKSSQAVSAISAKAFTDIVDKASAAASSISILTRALGSVGDNSKGFIEELNVGIENMINNLLLFKDSLVGTKENEKILNDSDALKKTLELIDGIKGSSKNIDKDVLDSLKKQNLVYADILSKNESLASIFAKSAIYQAGFADRIDIGSMSGLDSIDFAKNLSTYQSVLNEITDSADEAENPIASLSGLVNKYQKASTEASKLSAAAAKVDLSTYDLRTKAAEKLISQLEKERDIRLKLLDIAQEAADFEKSLKEEQIKYQEALAVGDMATAAQSQLNIKKIQEDRQRELTRVSITDTYQKQIDAQKKIIQDLQDKKDATQAGYAKATATAAQKAAALAEVKSFEDRINKIITLSPDGNFTDDDKKELKAIFDEMLKSNNKAVVASAQSMLAKYPSTKSSLYSGGKPIPTTLEPSYVLLAKALADKVNLKEGVFSKAVDKFIDAVDKFAGSTSGTGTGTKQDPFKISAYSLPDRDPSATTAAGAAPIKNKNGEITQAGLKYIITSKKYQKGKYFTVDGVDYIVESGFDANIMPGRARKLAWGGYAKKYDFGGNVRGPGTSTSDSIPAMLSDGEYVFSARAVNNAGGPDAVDNLHNALKRADGGPIASWMKPKSPYNSKGKPTGSPYGRYWGELERLYQQSPMGFDKNGKPIFNNDGKDPWGGTEPGHNFIGKVPQFSDYLHQLGEQPRKSSGPGMGLDRSPDRYAGSGASMGGIGSGAYGLINSLFMAEGGLAKKQNWFQRYVSRFNSKDNPAAEMFGTAQLLRLIAGQGKGGDALGAAMLPLNFMGAGLGSKLGMPIKGLAQSSKLSTLALTNKSLSEDTIKSIQSYQAAMAKNRSEISRIKTGEFYKDNPWIKPENVDNVIDHYQQSNFSMLKNIKLARKTDTPPGGINALEMYGQKPMFAQQDDWGIINTMLTRKSIGESQTMYRGLSMKDMADIVGYQTRPARALQNGKEWMDKFGYTSKVDEAPWTHFASGWKDNAVELIKKSGLPEPRYSDLEASAPFKWFAPALKPGQSWIPDKAKSFTDSLTWAKNIAHQGGTAGGETDAIAKVIFDKNVKGIPNLMDLGIGGNRASLSDKEMYIAPFTEYILKQINPLAHKIPGEGSFVGNQWIGGKNYSKLLDEYVFEAKRTLPSPHIPHFAGGGLISKILLKAKSLAYKPINFLNQYMNYFKARGMVKKGMFHGSADLGSGKDAPFSGTTELRGDYSRDPYYGMGFYGTTSKAEADLYAGGYNAPGQWGESYGTLNKISKIPFGKYLDFNKDLKKQNYALWKLFGNQGFMGAGENLGSIMNSSGMTGSIMPRVSAGMAPNDINLAKWIALNKPKGTVLQELGLGFANGGMVGPSYNVPSSGLSIGNNQNMGYNKGGSIHHYNAGGIVVNGAQGQDVKELANHIVTIMDARGSRRNSMNGGGITV